MNVVSVNPRTITPLEVAHIYATGGTIADQDIAMMRDRGNGEAWFAACDPDFRDELLGKKARLGAAAPAPAADAQFSVVRGIKVDLNTPEGRAFASCPIRKKIEYREGPHGVHVIDTVTETPDLSGLPPIDARKVSASAKAGRKMTPEQRERFDQLRADMDAAITRGDPRELAEIYHSSEFEMLSDDAYSDHAREVFRSDMSRQQLLRELRLMYQTVIKNRNDADIRFTLWLLLRTELKDSVEALKLTEPMFETVGDIIRGLTERVDALEARRALHDADVWQSGEQYDAGALVTYQGAGWICREKTISRPGTSSAWRLAIKSR